VGDFEMACEPIEIHENKSHPMTVFEYDTALRAVNELKALVFVFVGDHY
jgi:hypothetical protein